MYSTCIVRPNRPRDGLRTGRIVSCMAVRNSDPLMLLIEDGLRTHWEYGIHDIALEDTSTTSSVCVRGENGTIVQCKAAKAKKSCG